MEITQTTLCDRNGTLLIKKKDQTVHEQHGWILNVCC